MKNFLIGMLIVFVAAMILTAADNTKRPGYYDDRGYTLSEMITFAIDSSTVSGNQLKRRVMTVPITIITAGADTMWTQLFTVPAGQTITVTEMILSSHTEATSTNDSSWGAILYEDEASTLDTAVAQFWIDTDSLAYADTIYTLTMIDSVFTAGDIVTWWTIAWDAAITAGEGAAITIEYLLDE